jgi:voltage-gated potassium channel
VPLALASLALMLVAVIELVRDISGPWEARLVALGWALWGLFFAEFAADFVLAPVKRHYLREHWLDALIVLLPFLRILRVVQLVRALPALRCWS